MNKIEFWNGLKEKAKSKSLSKQPKPEMQIYTFADEFFDSKMEFCDYCEVNNLSDLAMYSLHEIEYFRNIGDKSDVIHLNIHGNECFVCTCDEDGYLKYNPTKSIATGVSIWEYQFGNISKYYKAFRDRGIIFENDVYGKISKKYKRIAEMAR